MKTKQFSLLIALTAMLLVGCNKDSEVKPDPPAEPISTEEPAKNNVYTLPERDTGTILFMGQIKKM